MAERLSRPETAAAGMGAEVQDAGQRFARASADLAAIWMDVFSRVAQQAWGAWPSGMQAPFGAPVPPQPAGPAGSATAAVEIVSARRAVVTVDLRPGAATRMLTASPLAPEKGSHGHPITGVAFVPSTGSGPPRVVVTIPPDQPPGLHAGDLRDTITGEGFGMVTVRVYE